MWRNSLHSHTMGAGILWQIQLMNPEPVRACLKCHAPLTEQFALLAQDQHWSSSRAEPPADIPADLHRRGLACAACHVRKHQYFGPPPGSDNVDLSIHGGFTEHTAFQDSRFCATCHQFPEDGPRLNNKLREDTYNQWMKTRFATEGRSCQSCHMPERKHAWKGIHDPEMTRAALSVALNVAKNNDVTARVTNSGAGHHFPTYIVPVVELILEYQSPTGETRELSRHTLAWRANIALTEERFDQRLKSGESVQLQGRLSAGEEQGSVRLRVSVSPRNQYLITFTDYLERKGNDLNTRTLGLLKQAIQEASAARYEYVAAERPVGEIAN